MKKAQNRTLEIMLSTRDYKLIAQCISLAKEKFSPTDQEELSDLFNLISDELPTDWQETEYVDKL